ncbi:hypothetical protein BGX27_007277 [Mortierella sp. AM989]|nr:hypothetical protein BGX27_007277 [Mortierella sp. AM989]
MSNGNDGSSNGNNRRTNNANGTRNESTPAAQDAFLMPFNPSTTITTTMPIMLPPSQDKATITTAHMGTTNSTTSTIVTTTTGANMISTSIAAVAAVTTTAPNVTGHVVSQKTVEALGDLLLESASVQSIPASQEQRRKQSYKSSSLINKTMKQSQEERRRQALAEQAKKRYQFTNHARKLALFASGQPSEETSDSEGSDSQDEEDDEEDDENDEDDNEDDDDNDGADEDEEQENNNTAPGQGKKKKKRLNNKHSPADKGNDAQVGVKGASSVPPAKSTAAHKRRLSSGSESESLARRKTDHTGDILSPKKPRLQKKNSSNIAKKRRKDRNPFRDQMMIPEALTDIPIDLDSNYYIVPLPIGHRCFVISADGKTTARLPSGQLLVSAFDSCLPAGSNQYRGNRRSDYCILDCVYSSATRTFWTLDIMCWRGHPVYECETEFRFWWLRGKLAEIEELQGKWISSQTKEWEHELEKKKQKRIRQLKKRQEKAAATAAAAAMDVVPTESSEITVQEEGDDGDDEAGTEVMEIESNLKAGNAGSAGSSPRKFWPVVFTPLPYFNASINLVRLLAESMHQPTPTPSLPSSPPIVMSKGSISLIPPISHSLSPSSSSLLPVPSTLSMASVSKSTPITSLSLKSHPKSTNNSVDIFNTTAHNSSHNMHNGTPSNIATTNTTTSCTAPPSILGTMALSGEIATAASLFPAHDNTQKRRQEQTLVHERAAGLVFFNKKTMYVLGSTPLCGWVSMEQIGDVFFDEEGGVGPVPGTSAAEGREVEMEDALERIRI